MSEKYDFKKTEKKWQQRWENTDAYRAVDFSDKPKYYVMSEFFGPSGKGIHLGHVKCYTPTEVVARYKRLKGFNVLYPVGWDAFGLPTENSALKQNIKPDQLTSKNIEIFTKQLKSLGFSFDWSREFATTDKNYYKWTQWIFLKLFENGLAYKSEGMVNFCPTCNTVLSNEDSQNGECDRCHSEVVQEKRNVWYLKMKEYSDKMLAGIDAIDMKENLKESQRNWIGRSEGAEIDFAIDGTTEKLTVFTTRPDTVYGVTFMVISPEHPVINSVKERIENYSEVEDYKREANKKSAIERNAAKEKTGVCLKGVYAVNPVTKKNIPIFTADYVMMGYGTGAIMAVPAHDERDYDFAKKFGIDIIEVISGGDIASEAYTGDGKLINSDIINGLNTSDAKKKMLLYFEEQGIGTRKVNYKMQDWPFNRQRYWGEPFPIIICDKCGYVPLSESELPLVLPEVSDMTPDEKGNGPLIKSKEFYECTCPKCGGKAHRETDTMPNWAGSSWYWLRFMDPHNDKEFVSKDKLNYWGEVDLYTGGTEHVTRHMLYASFWHNFLYDIKAVPKVLPFKRRMCNGLILDQYGKKMGKSAGNAVDPMEILADYGADAFRLHILFMGDYEMNTNWTLEGINGCTNFLNKVWALPEIMTDENAVSQKHEKALHTLIKKADLGIVNDNTSSGDHNDFKFNTVIAGMMEFINEIRKDGYITKEEMRNYLIIMNPFVPHITSELYENIFGKDINFESFPILDESKLVEDNLELPIQINGKLKGRIIVPKTESEDSIKQKAAEAAGITEFKKIIYVKDRIVNIIV